MSPAPQMLCWKDAIKCLEKKYYNPVLATHPSSCRALFTVLKDTFTSANFWASSVASSRNDSLSTKCTCMMR